MVSVVERSAGDRRPLFENDDSRIVEATIARMIIGGESFWSAARQPFLNHELARRNLRAVVEAGLRNTKGDYESLLNRYHVPLSDLQKFRYFLRKYQILGEPVVH